MLQSDSFFKHSQKKFSWRSYRRPTAAENGSRAIRCGVYNRKLRRPEKTFPCDAALNKAHPEFKYKSNRYVKWLMRKM